MRFNLAIV